MHKEPETPALAAHKAPIARTPSTNCSAKPGHIRHWLPEPVPVELLRKAYELARLGPTSANGFACKICVSNHDRGKGALAASDGSRQCRENHDRAGHGHHCLGHGIPRKPSQALSPI